MTSDKSMRGIAGPRDARAMAGGVILSCVVGFLVLALGCANEPACPCPAVQVGPGWCPADEVIGTGHTCICQVTTLCPGWCLSNGQPVQCGRATDAGEDMAPDAAADVAATDARSED